MDQEAFGATSYDRERRLKSGGYKIITSLDPGVQDAAKKNVEQYYKTGKNHPNALMVAAIEPGTGYVRALAVNRNYKLDPADKPQNGLSTDPAKKKRKIRGTYPNTTNPLLSGGGDITGYQAGSTFKIFTLVAALEKGYPLSYTINAKAVYTVEVHRGIQRTERLPGHQQILSGEREQEHGRRAQHVGRFRQVGQHLLRPARGAGRRGQRGRRGQADGHQVPRPRATR